MRINKFIALSGLTSRRKADEMILDGRVSVNGSRLKEPGYEVLQGDIVEVDGSRVEPEDEYVYYLLNKPVGYVTTTSDEYGRPTVLDIVNSEKRIFPVGRLDANTSGLLILTNDGEFANKLMHPSEEIDKKYRAAVSGILTKAKAERISKGVDIGGFVTSSARVEIIKHCKNSTILDIIIHEGKNHQVRRMLKAAGHPVQTLERTGIGNLVIGRLACGSYRKLSDKEVMYFLREQ